MTPDAENQLLAREQFGMRFGLERMRLLLHELGDPQDAFPAVHVVGTNGKTSTTLMTAAALRAQHLDAGAFVSPHLRSFRERVDVEGSPVGEAEFEAAASRVFASARALDSRAAMDDQVTQFEAVTAIAFVVLATRGVDVAVIEAGLGGRLDATNVLGDSRVQVLTSVGLDHTEYLGETLEEIAHEKLAVVRSRAALVCGRLPQVVEAEANRVADERDARLIEALGRVGVVAGAAALFEALPEGFVRDNAVLALAAAETALARIRPGKDFDREAAVAGIVGFAGSKRLEGRLQVAGGGPLEIRDVAHNEEAASALVAAVPAVAGTRPVTLVVAMLRDKNTERTLSALLPAVTGGSIVCTSASNPRSLEVAELAAVVRRLAPEAVIETVGDPTGALARARELAGPAGAVLVTGSNYLVSDLLRGPSAPAGATL